MKIRFLWKKNFKELVSTKFSPKFSISIPLQIFIRWTTFNDLDISQILNSSTSKFLQFWSKNKEFKNFVILTHHAFLKANQKSLTNKLLLFFFSYSQSRGLLKLTIFLLMTFCSIWKLKELPTYVEKKNSEQNLIVRIDNILKTGFA